MAANNVTLRVWWRGCGLPRFELDGQPVGLDELAELYGLSGDTVLARARRGLPVTQWFLSAAELSRLTKQAARRAA
jgi:hypothetical protein